MSKKHSLKGKRHTPFKLKLPQETIYTIAIDYTEDQLSLAMVGGAHGPK